MSIGNNIKQRRIELNMSQQDLAAIMGYKTRSTIAKIETGENDVSHKKLQKFAAALNTSVEALLHSAPPAAPTIKDPLWAETARHRTAAVVLAGGKSDHFHQSLPPQFISIHGKPLIVYALEAYQAHPSIDDIYIACLKGWESIVRAYADQFGITKLRGLIPAGETGILSLKNAVEYISEHYSEDDLIFIQESTRPLVSVETISTLLQASAEKDSATICHSMNEYVQFRTEAGKVEYIDRNSIIAIQSPEAHRLSVLRQVFDTAVKKHHPLTESCCTMLLYNLGFDINFVEGNVNNVKIARDEDIAAFRAITAAI
jgi:2-C-methyl-D-erythritol 4-phosphate cytidylyltransferase